MARRRRLKVFNVFLAFCLLAALFVAFGWGIKYIYDLVAERETPIVEPAAPVKKFKMEILDYEYYKPTDLDFNFLIINCRLSDKAAFTYSLADLYTDEKLNCADVEHYLKALEAKAYYLGYQKVTFKVESQEKSNLYRFFIPVIDRHKKEITIFDALSKAQFKLDLTKNLHDPTLLKNQTEQEIGNEFCKLKVAAPYSEDRLFIAGRAYETVGQQAVYCFTLDITALKDSDIKLKEAFLVFNEQEEIRADKELYAPKLANALNHELFCGERLGLYFIIPTAEGLRKQKADLRLILNNGAVIALETEIAG